MKLIEEVAGAAGWRLVLVLFRTVDGPMGFAKHTLRDKALEALEEAAAAAAEGPVQRSKALGFALAYLWAASGAERDQFDWFWKSLAGDHEIGRAQNVNASLKGIYLALGLRRP
ncbi:hypothetical protein [Sphingosinicella sp. BN140058]|uniref:hypothetical protein n=1 Tax=Sphingosinicella sp. BN140058 TaxID=1892855 RepID=UPI00101322B1|nr:hypothetical protein [Sphingosinicella sp. BN140058]QAY80313.1 hypothetical protein ETR14_27095 [Sphingosinicella sp. BN140058]